MRLLSLTALTLASLAVFVACGGTDDVAGKDFDRGRPGASGGAGGEATGGVGGETGGVGGEVSEAEAPDFLADYPAGPYGDDLNAILPNYRVTGWRNPQSVDYDIEQLEVIQMSDYYDPDGSKNIKLIMINSSAQWCPPCRAEYRYFDTNGTYAKYRALGVEFIGSLMENNANDPPRLIDGQAWAKSYKVPFPFLIDTGFKLGGLFTMDAIPNNSVVDAKTMKIIRLLPGGDTAGMLAYFDRELPKH